MSEVDLSEMESDMIGVTKECTLTLMAPGDNWDKGCCRAPDDRSASGITRACQRVAWRAAEMKGLMDGPISLCVLCNDNRLMRVSWCRSLMVRRPAANAVRGGAHSTHSTRLMVHLRRSSTFTNTWCCELRFRPTVFRWRVHFRPFQAELGAVVDK